MFIVDKRNGSMKRVIVYFENSILVNIYLYDKRMTTEILYDNIIIRHGLRSHIKTILRLTDKDKRVDVSGITFIVHVKYVTRISLTNVNNHISIDAAKVLDNPNAGGNSILSEVLACDILYRLHGAKNVHTEMEVNYIYSNWKICDFTMEIYDNRVGISVTRAMNYKDPSEYKLENADTLLRKKLYGLILTRDNATYIDTFYTSILFIWCQTTRIAELLCEAYNALDESLTPPELIIYCVVSDVKEIFIS